MVVFPADEHFLAEARTAAQEIIAKVTAQLGELSPPPVTVQAVFGLPAGKLIEASEDADLLVAGSRGTYDPGRPAPAGDGAGSAVTGPSSLESGPRRGVG